MKKFTTRFLTVFLAIAILISALPMSVFAAEFNELLQDSGESVHVGENSAEGTEEKEVYALGEDTALRTAKSKHIRMSDGSYYAAVYANDVHFLNDEGEWEEIDNTLIASNASGNDDISGVATTNGKINVKFANSSNSSKLIAIKTDDYKISFGLVGANSAKGITVSNPEPLGEDISELERLLDVKKSISSVVYNDILENTDLEYIVSGNRIKENIIVKEKSDSYVYEFDMKLNKLTAEIASDGTIVLKDEKSGESIFVIALPYMYDANGETSDAVTYSLEKIKNKEYRITVTADSAWMNDKSRAYPVTIDPPIGFSANGVEDAYVDEAYPAVTNGSGPYLKAGYAQSKYIYSYLRITDTLSIPKNAIIVSATLCLKPTGVTATNVYIGAYEQLTSWTESTLTWNNKGNVDINLVDYQTIDSTVISSENGAVWDITALAQKWHSGTSNNYGVVLKPISAATGVATFQSSDLTSNPVFIINYRNIVGLESYYSYQFQSAGRAGTGYINHYNSNLTLTRGILSSASEIMPFSISHVYNSANANLDFNNNVNQGIHTADFSKMKVGKGWKLSVQETLVTKTIGSKTYLVYNDSDGTEHYFLPTGTSNTWEDEDGMNLTVTLNTTTQQYHMTDKGDNRKTFKNGFLTHIVDANGNVINFVYNSNNQLTSITRLNVGGTTETLASFSYNSSYYLTSVTDAYSRATSFTYSSGQLTKVTFPDGNTVSYTYTTSGKMNEAYDSEANYGILYTVSNVSGVGETITSVREFYKNGSTNVSGNKFDIELNPGYRSSYVDYGADGSLGTADDIVTTYRFDRMGRTITAYSTDKNHQKIYGANSVGYTADTGATAHRVSASAVTGVMPTNYMKNGSMEQSSTWSLTNASYNSSSAHTGTRSMQLSTTSSTTRSIKQTVALPNSDVYTASAYVNVSALSGNVYIKVTDTSGRTTWTGDAVTSTLRTSTEDPWQRITCTFYPENGWGSNFEISVISVGSGTVYVDDVQVESFAAPSNYNLIGDLSLWTMANAKSELSTYSTAYGSVPSIAMYGTPSSTVYATTTVPINRPSDTAFMFSAWASGTSVPTGDFTAYAMVKYKNVSETETIAMSFQKGISIGEQFLTGMIVPQQSNKTIESITLLLSFSANSGGMHFYNLALVEESAQTYSYDSEGNLTAANQTDSESISSTYDSSDRLTSQSQGNENYTYTYKTSGNKHLVNTVTSDGVTMTFTYDAAGNVTGTVITATGTTNNMSSGSTYSTDKNFVLSSTDTSNNTTYYGYNSNDLLSYTRNAKGTYVYYEYNGQNDRQTKAYINGVVSASYAYTKGALSTITRTGTANGTSKTQTYSFTYDNFGNVTQVKVGTSVLVSYEYAANNGNLTKTTYGNGTYIENVYDVLDRIVQIKYNGSIKYKYAYNGNGDLCEIEDVANSIKYRYEYDSLDRLCASYTVVNNSVRIVSDYTYDGKSRVTAYTCGMTGATGGSLGQTYGYVYNDRNGTISSMTVSASGVSDTLSFTYDALQRLTAKNTVRTGLTLAQTYAYKTISGNRTSTLISGLTQKVNGTTVDSYTYTYDSLGNITVINRNGYAPISYTYDVQNQLIKVVEGDVRYEYAYDTYGNLLSVKMYEEGVNELVSTNTYTYGDSQWIDRLTAFNSVGITYDGIGNPLSYYNGSSYTFTWNGRELMTAVKGGVTTTYKYGADGLRTQKTVGSTVYNYYYADGRLVRQTWGSNYMDFLYDENGNAYSFVYNGTQYYYVRNLQGDVVKILNTSGAVVASYFYDAWGKVTASGSIGQLNPIRYRGYYYDTDTGFYYLQSRYYDPAVKRFISADGYINANGDLLGYNMYAYCRNNPANSVDAIGTEAEALKLWSSSMWWLCGADAVLPVGDVIYFSGIVILGICTTVSIAQEITNLISFDDEANDKERNLPVEGEPNSSQELYDDDGELKQKRYYGPDGKATEDIDYKHQNSHENHEFPHKHTWDWSKKRPRSKPFPYNK